ncbi:MAG TPA: hypothetical protein VKG26_03395 [Bacteroidia bacterium]|nr:hypothetical protein [Bacteroidia bacterium]
MLHETVYTFEEHTALDLYKTESIKNFNKQLSDNLLKNMELLENELLSLTDLLIADGNLLQGAN